MIFALLDHPWPLESTLDGNSEGYQVLREFDRLAKKHALKPVPFVSQTEYDQIWARFDYRRYSGKAIAQLRRDANQFVRSLDGDCFAAPSNGPADLSRDWKAALREAAVDDWRNPQIVVSAVRRASWPYGDEVLIEFEPCRDGFILPPQERILVELDAYEDHPYVKSDFDPWDLQRQFPPPPGAAPHMRHPCYLPKPPEVRNGLDHLEDDLAMARRRSLGSDGKYYFIPGEDWKYAAVPRDSWRSFRPFPYRKCKGGDRNGYVDCNGLEWAWDNHERHWDVQTDPYCRVSHSGDLIS